VALVLLPFLLAAALPSVWSAAQAMATLHAYTQNSADNLWTLLPVWRTAVVTPGPFGEVPDGLPLLPGMPLTYLQTGLLAVLGLQLLILRRLGRWPNARQVSLAAATLGVGFFFLSTRMHVNYVFLALPFLCALAASGGWRERTLLGLVTLACVVDWQDGLPWAVHRLNAAVYAVSLVGLCAISLGARLGIGRPWLARPAVTAAPRRPVA
jgi:hypothetical protein